MSVLRRVYWSLSVAFLILLAGGCEPSQQTPKAEAVDDSPAPHADAPRITSEEMPIRRVVLYQNGVGYFERQGEIESDVITLRVRPEQINDLLKSLTVLDLSAGGRAVSITLPVNKNAADQRDDLPHQLQSEGGLLTLLRTFRGAEVSLFTKGGKVVGRIAGVESLPSFNAEGQREEGWRVLLRSGSGSLDVVAVSEIDSLKIRDRSLEVGLEKSLDVSLNEGSWKPIELKVRLDSAKKRTVRVSYITEMPVWKPAYRLVFDDSEKGLFQGWAVTDNVSGGDWEKISMSLVAGNPISFMYDLYEPQFVARQDLSGRVKYSALAPPKVESVAVAPKPKPKLSADPLMGLGGGGMGGGGSASGKGSGRGMGGGGLRERSTRTPKLKPGRFEVGVEDYEESFGAVAEGKELSSLYEYVISGKDDPGVTIRDRSSALVNIVQTTSSAKEVVLFQPKAQRRYNALNPYRAVEFENGSGHPLEPGPISLYRTRDGDSTFIGESFLEKTEKDERAFFTFALDPLIELATTEAEKETLNQITFIKNGLLTSEVKRLNTVTYTLKNKSEAEIEAVISRPKRMGWAFTASDNARVDEASLVRYMRVSLPAGGEVEVLLTETRLSPRRYELSSREAMSMFEAQISEAAMDPALKAALADVLKKREEMALIAEALGRLNKKRTELEDIQRLNADLLESIEGIRNAEANKLKRKYSADMNKARTELVKTRADISLSRNRQMVGQKLLDSLYAKVTFGEAPEGGAAAPEATRPRGKRGSLDKKIIKRVVSRNKRGLTNCYEKQLRKNPRLKGRINIMWRISATGNVDLARVKSNEMGNSAVANCLVSRIKGWRFPAPKGGGSVNVTYPFNFDAQ